jgi:hypothetical protein
MLAKAKVSPNLVTEVLTKFGNLVFFLPPNLVFIFLSIDWHWLFAIIACTRKKK